MKKILLLGVNTMTQTKTEIEYAQMTNDLSSLPITFVYDDVVYKGFSPEYFKEVSKETSHERNRYSKKRQYDIHRYYGVL